MVRWLERLGLGTAAVPQPAQEATPPRAIRAVNTGDFRIEVDLSGQVLRLAAPKGGLHEQQRLQPAVSGFRPGGLAFVSAALLAHKAKQFDDGLYAAVELALQDGAGEFRGKQWLLETLAPELDGLPGGSGSTVAGVLFGAARLGALSVTIPPHLAEDVNAALARFRRDPAQSKPLSFYTWFEELRRIFVQDRMLQQELTGAAEIGALAGALRRSDLKAVYESYLSFVARLTNPPPAGRPDLCALIDDPAADVPGKGVFFFPPSRAPETELVKKLYGDRPIPADFSISAEMIARLRAGTLDVQPRAGSGWYDHQTWAHAALVLSDRLPEGKRLSLDRSYAELLEELFKALLALTRETHIKQLEVPPASAAAGPPAPVYYLAPEISVEPVYSYYVRRAAGYRFLRQILEQQFGAAGLARMRRITAEGPVSQDLDSELEEITALFEGASAATARELGLAGEQENAAPFQDWAQQCERDPDLARDARMMVPLFYDLARHKTKVWVLLGWASAPLEVSFAERPPIQVFDQRGRPAGRKLQVELASQWHPLIFPVTAEVYVSRILDRREFRALCDRHKFTEGILKSLE